MSKVGKMSGVHRLEKRARSTAFSVRDLHTVGCLGGKRPYEGWREPREMAALGLNWD